MNNKKNILNLNQYKHNSGGEYILNINNQN